MTTNAKQYPTSTSKKSHFWQIFLIVCCVVEIIEELIYCSSGWLLWPNLPHVSLAVITEGVCVILSWLCQRGKNFWIRSPETDIGKHLISCAKIIWKRYIRFNTLAASAFALLFITYAPAYLANHHISQKLAGAFYAPIEEVSPTSAPYNSGGSDEDDHSEDEDDHSNSDTNQEKTNSAGSISEKSLAERLVLMSTTYDKLSTDDFTQIFFLDGEYAITNWSDPQAVLEQVRKFLLNKQMIAKDPNYAEIDTPQTTKDEIARASLKEDDMWESEAPTSLDLEKVIDIRNDSYHAYPEYRLAKLIRENFGMYGDAYQVQGKSRITAEVMYEHSILWGFEALTYTVNDDDLCRDLTIISERYKKIATVVKADSSSYHYAIALATAFETLSWEF